MEKLKLISLALIFGLMLVPFSLYLQKFTKIEAFENPKVTFDPQTCFKCKDCPCIYTLSEGKQYRLNRLNKIYCDLPVEEVNNSLTSGNTQYTANIELRDYLQFEDCVKWYSLHPNNY